MSINLNGLYASQFASNIQLLLQQKESRLRSLVMSGSHKGDKASPVDQLGAVNMSPVVGRFEPITRTDGATDRRWVLPYGYDLTQQIDHSDALKLLLDPQSSYVQNAVNAANRKFDDLIISAFFGTAQTGVAGATGTVFPVAATHQVAVNQGAAGNTGMTVAKLRKAKQLLMSYEVDLDNDPLTCVVNSIQHDNLLAEAQVTSLDFNDRPVMMEGRITRFLGINFIHSERLGVDGSSYRRCPVFAKSGMYLGIWEDMKIDVSQRKDIKGLPYQIYSMLTAGATRLEENKIIEIKCAE